MTDFLAAFPFWADRQIASGLIVAIALLLAAGALFKQLKPWAAHLRARTILSANEKEFFYRLTRALPACHVFPQISFSALIAVNKALPEKQQFAIRRHFGWKYADFVICRPGTLEVLAVIELDDRTHNAKNDCKRDALLARVGYRTLRFQSTAKPSEAEIATLFSGATSTS